MTITTEPTTTTGPARQALSVWRGSDSLGMLAVTLWADPAKTVPADLSEATVRLAGAGHHDLHRGRSWTST